MSYSYALRFAVTFVVAFNVGHVFGDELIVEGELSPTGFVPPIIGAKSH